MSLLVSRRLWFVLLAIGAWSFTPLTAHAVAQYVQTNSAARDGGGTSISVSYPAAATAGSLLVAICGHAANAAVTGPGGFSTAIMQAGTPSQGIFYKIASGGETSLSCSGGAASERRGIHIYEYRGVDKNTPLHATSSATGLTSPANSGTVTTTNTNTLLVTGLLAATSTFSGTWSNGFTQRNIFSTGSILGTSGFAGADRAVSSAGAYSTTLDTGLGNWQGQIAAFNLTNPSLSTDIVNGAGSSVPNPTVSMPATISSFSCNTVTGSMGTAGEKIRVQNYTASSPWSLSIAPTNGGTSRWSTGTVHYDFNDANGTPSGCADGGDADTLAGRLTINPSLAIVTPETGCTPTGIAKGSGTSFDEVSVSSITLLSATSSAQINCYWDLTDVGVSQTILPEQPAGSYSINMTLTLTAS